MKSNCLLFCCLWATVLASAQNNLTLRQSMDWEPGDEFQYLQSEVSAAWAGIEHTTLLRRRVLSKSYSPDSTHIYYQIERLQYQDSCRRSLDTIQESYTDLDSSILYAYIVGGGMLWVPSGCALALSAPQLQSDTTQYCNLRHSESVRSAFGYDVERHGLGLGVTYRYTDQNMCASTYELLYYKKGMEVCGTPNGILTNDQTQLPQRLTRRQVYDFDLGDEFHLEYLQSGYQYYNLRYIRRVVVGKKAHWADSVAYTIAVYDSSATSGMVQTELVSQGYANLNLPSITDSCGINTGNWDSCGHASRSFNRRYQAQQNYQIEQLHIAGCGNYDYSSFYSFPAATVTRSTLLYYKKAVSGDFCGTPLNFPPVAVEEQPRAAPEWSIYHSPEQNALLLYRSQPLTEPSELLLFDALGRLALSARLPDGQPTWTITLPPSVGSGLWFAKVGDRVLGLGLR